MSKKSTYLGYHHSIPAYLELFLAEKDMNYTNQNTITDEGCCKAQVIDDFLIIC